MQKVTLGIDIGGTNTKFGIVSKDGKILVSDSISTIDYQGKSVETFLSDLYKAFEALLNRLPPLKYKIIGIGIGAPNANYYSGCIEFAPNLPWHNKIELVKLFKEHYPDLPIALTNDANAAAIGEMIYGAAQGYKDFIVITLGTGVGSGIVANGELIYGHDGFAGEMGHNITIPNGRLCTCGRKGCLEAYASARGIKQTAVELLAATNEHSELRQHLGPKFSTVHIHQAALMGDKIALDVFEQTGKVLAMEMSNAVGYLSPAAFFLFGGITKVGELLFEPIRRYFESFLLNIFQNKIKVYPSAFDGSDAAILGASALIIKELKKKKKAPPLF
jgi:glucokinase